MDLFGLRYRNWTPNPGSSSTVIVKCGASRSVLGWIWGVLLLGLPCTGAIAVPVPLPNPNLQIGIQGEVHASVFLPDGGVILGGRFHQLNGILRSNLAKLRPDGSLDPTWNPGADGDVQALALSPDGTAVYVGGDFSRIANVERQHIAKLSVGGGAAIVGWNPSIDGGSPDGMADVVPMVSALTVDSNGDVYIGGQFWRAGGQQRASIARVSAGGTVADWKPNAYAGNQVPGSIRALVLSLDGAALFVGGDFIQIGSTKDLSNIAKVNTAGGGTVQQNWKPRVTDSFGWNAQVSAVAINPDSAMHALYVSGEFIYVNGEYHPYLAKLDTEDGMEDSNWLPIPSDYVNALAVDESGYVYAGGSFYSIGSNQRSRHGLARLLGAGSGAADLGWQADVEGDGFNGVYGYAFVEALALGNAGRLSVGGYYGQIKGQKRASFALLDDDGNLEDAVTNVDDHGTIYAVAHQSDGGMIVGGSFTRVNGEDRRGLVRLRPDGSLDPNWHANTDGSVRALVIDSTDGIFAGGSFNYVDDTANSYYRPAAAKLLGNGVVIDAWSFPADYGSVYTLALSGSTDLYVGGYFSAGGRQNLVKVTQSSGGLQAGFAPPVPDNIVYAIAVTQDNGGVFVGGAFDQLGTTPRYGLAKLAGATGALDMGWVADLGFTWWYPSAYALAIGNSGSSLYVGGEYYGIGDCWYCNYLASVSVDSGHVSLQFNPSSNGTVYSIYAWDYVVDDPAIYVGGAFSMIGGDLRRNAAKLSVDGSADSLWNPSFDGTVNALTVSGTANLAVGGGYDHIDAQPRTGVAVLPRAGSNLVFSNGFER